MLCVPRLTIYLWATVGSSLVFVSSLRSGEGHAGLFMLQEEVLVYKSCLYCLLRVLGAEEERVDSTRVVVNTEEREERVISGVSMEVIKYIDWSTSVQRRRVM